MSEHLTIYPWEVAGRTPRQRSSKPVDEADIIDLTFRLVKALGLLARRTRENPKV